MALRNDNATLCRMGCSHQKLFYLKDVDAYTEEVGKSVVGRAYNIEFFPMGPSIPGASMPNLLGSLSLV